MNIVEDHFQRTGETLRQACERMRHTHTITQAAYEIGFDTTDALQAALRKRGIRIEWALSPFRPRPELHIPDQTLDRFITLRQMGYGTREAADLVGRCPHSIQRSLRTRRPGLKLPHGNSRPRTYTRDVLISFEALRRQGLSISRAAVTLGVDEANILRAFRQQRSA